jgi:U3 small nucleolar RNA-associated protein 4
LRSMILGSRPVGGPKEIIIWSIKALPDGTIVSGDSTGELRIWDGKTYTFMQRVKSHKQDILSLATSANGKSIISGGMDRRTVVYKQIGKGRMRWAEVSHRRYHKHDMKTMASFESKGMSCVVSGGKCTFLINPSCSNFCQDPTLLPRFYLSASLDSKTKEPCYFSLKSP